LRTLRETLIHSPGRVGALALAGLLVLAVSACNITQGPNGGRGPATREVVDPNAGLNSRERVELAIALLEQGHAGEARAQLTQAMEQNPKGAFTARHLIAQLDEDPETLLGTEYFNYEVRPGESLSLLAGRYLGDETLFYSLARYNDIAVPNRVPAGRTLKIPGRARSGDDQPPLAGTPRNRPDGNEQLQGASRPEEHPARDTMTGRIHLIKAEKFAQQGDIPAARERLGLARMFVATDKGLAERIDSMESDLDRQEADFLVHQANAALATGDPERAHQLLSRSVKLDPARQDASAQLAATTTQLVDEYHRVALQHLQGGHECSAMDAWSKILSIEPGNPDAEIQYRRVQSLLEGRQQKCVNV